MSGAYSGLVCRRPGRPPLAALATLVMLMAALALAAACAAPPAEPAADVDHAEASPEVSQASALLALLDPRVDAQARPALQQLAASGDERSIAVLIELLRGAELGLVRLGRGEVLDVLQRLSGQTFDTWSDWVVWYAATALRPPPGFATWKGHLYGSIDADFRVFLDDALPARVRIEEIVWGGVKVDGIPALDQPAVIPAAEAAYLNPDDLVFGVAINGDYRAYPLRIMDWHEMANDTVGGVPVTLAYCTLCGAGILFDARAAETTFTFGSSGFLMRSNKLMYDRGSRSLWNQLTGEPVVGPLAEGGVQLARLPVVVTTWGEWRRRHPDSTVLSPDTGYVRPYTPGTAYGAYFASPHLMFPAATGADTLPAKTWVFALDIDGVARAYPIDLLAQTHVVNDVVGATPVVVIGGASLRGAGIDLQAGDADWDAGAEVRAFDRGSHRFRTAEIADRLVDESGNLWSIGEDALRGPDGSSRPRLPGHLAYWFGWVAFHPDTSVYGRPE